MSTYGLVGDLLIKNGVVDAAALARAAEVPAGSATTLGRKLAILGLADEAVVARTVAKAAHAEFLDADVTADETAVALLTEEFCRKRNVD